MTALVVVDASALAAIAFKEPAGRDIRDRLANRQLVAPHLVAYELANTALTKLRRHLNPGDDHPHRPRPCAVGCSRPHR